MFFFVLLFSRTRYAIDGRIIDGIPEYVDSDEKFGIPQLVDPTYRNEILQVFKDTRYYFEDFVLLDPKYLPTRESCRNKHENCALWVAQGGTLYRLGLEREREREITSLHCCKHASYQRFSMTISLPYNFSSLMILVKTHILDISLQKNVIRIQSI